MNPSQVTDYGGAPLSAWNQGENSNATSCQPAPSFINVDGINPAMPYHKLFLYLEANRAVAGSDFYVQGSVTLYRARQPVIVLPASIAQDIQNGLLAQSLVTVFANNANGTNEATLLSLAKNFTTSTNPVTTPTKVTGIIDRVTYSVLSCGVAGGNSFTSFRAFLGILSSIHPF